MMMRDRDQQQELAVLRPRDERVDQAAPAARSRSANSTAAIGTSITSGSRWKAGNSDDRDIHRDRHHLAMGEIDDAHHAEDDRQAERHQAVDEAGQDAADGDVEIDIAGIESIRMQRCSGRDRAAGAWPTSDASAALVVGLQRPFRLGVGGSFGADGRPACRRGSGCRRALSLSFWPLASNWMPGPMLTLSVMLVVRIASASAFGSAEPARL